MSDTKAYTVPIGPDPAYGQSSPTEDGYINQSSPSWILTFIRWSFRDTLRIVNSTTQTRSLDSLKAVEEPLVVRSDCVDLSVTSDKGSHMSQMEAVLLETNVDYLTEVAPGDFVFVNMLNWEEDAEDVAQRASTAKSGINGVDDGFKGVFKVQSVRKTVAIINQNTGHKSVVVKITGFAFTELSNMIYFNQAVATNGTSGQLAFNPRIAEIWKSILTSGNPVSLTNILLSLSYAFLGTTFASKDFTTDASSNIANKTGQPTAEVLQSPNSKFYMPSAVGTLLGIRDVTNASQIYTFVCGVQSFGNTNANLDLFKGMNPSNIRPRGRAFVANPDCSGNAVLKPEYWNQVKAWDILSQYTNSPLNEFFACFRVHPADNKIVPTIVFRQIPFTSEDFAVNDQRTSSNVSVTKFLNLPRWQIDPSLVISQDLGRDEAARINFVQVFGRTAYGTAGSDFAAETARHNYVEDLNDIQRSGLRPAVISSMFDVLPQSKSDIYHAPVWAKIVGDALIGGHLKFNGTLVCAGIPEPVSIGDNLEYDGIVYHIETITHKCTITNDGKKTFRTIFSLSQGVLSNSSAKYGTLYPSMKYGNAYKEREVDYSNNQILPGVSESQSIPSRTPSVDQPAPVTSPNKPFPQPREIKGFPNSKSKPKKVK